MCRRNQHENFLRLPPCPTASILLQDGVQGGSDLICDSLCLRFVRLSIQRAAAVLGLLLLLPCAAGARGPRSIAGITYFNPAVLGQPVHRANGEVRYFVDQGALNATVSNQNATAMVDAAAALWSAVPTAGVTLTDSGSLNEDVNGANILAGKQLIAQPSDVTPSATSYPVGVIYDADGSVSNALFGASASDPASCENDGV